jgi:hypothetical protein
MFVGEGFQGESRTGHFLAGKERSTCPNVFWQSGRSLILLGLAGCAASGPPFHAVALQPTQAVIYIYRPQVGYAGSAIGLDILCDGKRVGTLCDNGYIYAVVSPGQHTVNCQTETLSQITYDFEAGKSYYIEASVVLGFFEGRPKLTMVPEDTGKLAILSTNLGSNMTQ